MLSSAFENLVELYQNDVLLSGAKATATTDSTKPNVYTVEWIVPRAGASGDAYTYDVKEKAIAQYVNGEVSGSTANGFAVTNTYAGSMGPSSTDDGVASGSDGEPSGGPTAEPSAGPTAEPSAGPGGESNENKFDLLVSTDSGRTITVEVTSSNTVLDVKEKILGGVSFGDEEIVLWYDCVEKMEDSRTLLSYGITSTVVLHLEWGDSERDKTKAPIERVTPGVGPGGGDVPQLPGFRQSDNAPIAATDGQGEGQGESQGQGRGQAQGQGQGQSQGEGQAQGQGQGGAPPAESNNDAGQSNNGSEGNTPDEA